MDCRNRINLEHDHVMCKKENVCKHWRRIIAYNRGFRYNDRKQTDNSVYCDQWSSSWAAWVQGRGRCRSVLWQGACKEQLVASLDRYWRQNRSRFNNTFLVNISSLHVINFLNDISLILPKMYCFPTRSILIDSNNYTFFEQKKKQVVTSFMFLIITHWIQILHINFIFQRKTLLEVYLTSVNRWLKTWLIGLIFYSSLTTKKCSSRNLQRHICEHIIWCQLL